MQAALISIHIPRIGDNNEIWEEVLRTCKFQSAPREGGDISTDDLKDLQAISIHASLVGGDRGRVAYGKFFGKFQSMPPLREATSTYCPLALE